MVKVSYVNNTNYQNTTCILKRWEYQPCGNHLENEDSFPLVKTFIYEFSFPLKITYVPTIALHIKMLM